MYTHSVLAVFSHIILAVLHAAHFVTRSVGSLSAGVLANISSDQSRERGEAGAYHSNADFRIAAMCGSQLVWS
jgi:hypothetical protein